MRMWGVPTHYLCRKHLLGEHVEMHMFVGTINKGNSIKGYILNGLVDPFKIKTRHDEIALEMEKRGMVHKSPLPELRPYALEHDEEDLTRGYLINVEENITELQRRCEDCRSRIAKHNN